MMRWYSLWIFFYTVGTNGFIIPDDVPTALSVFYSNAPKVKLGTDSRIGWGFRLGDRADAQILLELGPQQYTQRLANQQPFDNPNYPELSSSLDSEDDYNYETSEDEDAEEKDEEMSVEQKRVANETEAAVIRVEIEAMGNLISKLTDTVNDTNQTDQSESGDRQNEVTNNLIRTLEVKMNEEKEKLRDLELTSSSTVKNDIQELEENTSNNELREIIVKLKKYVEKATKTSGEALDDVAALEIETLKRLIKNLSGISKFDDGKDEELLSNESDPKNGTTIVEEKIQSNESDEPEYSTEEPTQHSNKENEKLQVIPKFINVTQDNHDPSVENDFQLLTKDEIFKSETIERKASKKTEDIEQNKELRSIDDQIEKKESSHTLSKNMEKEESPTDLRIPTNREKINGSIGMQQNLKPNDQIKDMLKEEYNDSNELNKTADTLIKFREINKERETVRIEKSGDFKKKKECSSSKIKVEDNSEDIQLKQALVKLKIKLNEQLENLNLNSTIEKQKFMKNLKILKILQEENNKRNEKYMSKSQNSIILEGSYKGVSLKAFQTLSALWVKQDPKISDIICDAKNETELTGKIINKINGSIDEGSVKNIAVDLEKNSTKSTENITKEASEKRSGMENKIATYKEKNETAKYESVEIQNEEKLVKIYEQSNEKKKIDNTTRKVELVNRKEQGSETTTMSMKNSTRIIEESETKSGKQIIRSPRKNKIGYKQYAKTERHRPNNKNNECTKF
ncbi:myosin-7-like [Coccinella septempunctata]|uniref:myosin-7-like n=1 Tax=Coccinella septempunctata TaxID=41139 RepID=UPI001D09555B|nr:myosin-7-like [Coccinella septempunctata]